MQISNLKTLAIPSLNDVLPILDINGGVSGKPILRKATIQSIFDLLPSTPGEGGNSSGGFSIPTTIKTVAANTDYFIGIDVDGLLYKITKANLLINLSNSSGGNSGGTEAKLVGTPFGASPSYYIGHEFDKAFDGDLATVYDYAYASGGYCGLDLGSSNTKKLTKIRVYPRQDTTFRSGGAKIQGSNSETTGYIDLFAFPATPSAGVWYEGSVQIATAYRYIRYYALDGTYCSVAEVEFYGV